METLKNAEKQVNELLAEIDAEIDEHHAKGEVLKKEAAARRESLANELPTSATDKGKGKEREVLRDSEDEDKEDKELPHNPAGEEHSAKRGALQHRLREVKLVLHKVKFLQGDVYHILGEAYSSAEAAAYEAAESVRRDLLKGMY